MARTYLFWDPLSDNILQERDETGAVTAEYTAEPGLYGNLISQNRSGVERQFHYDAQGSSLAVTDDNQNVTDTFAYTAFGEVTERTGTTEVPFQYIGQKGYYTNRQLMVRRRPYEPARGRWLSRDPFDTLDRTSVYRYARNNPAMLIDPTGLYPTCDDEEKKLLTCQEFLKLVRDRSKEIGDLSASLEDVFKCKVDIYCGTCQGFDAYTWIDSVGRARWGHICLNEKKTAEILEWLALFLHEAFHFVQNKGAACGGLPFPGDTRTEPPPRGSGKPSKEACKACKEYESGAYERQARFIYPGEECRTVQALFVEWGLCYSCQHVCKDDDPCDPSAKNDKLKDALSRTPGCKAKVLELPPE